MIFLYLVLDCFHEHVSLESYIVYLIITYLYSYILDVGFKLLVELYHLVRGEALMKVEITEINLVAGEDCCCAVALLGRYYLQLGSENWRGRF